MADNTLQSANDNISTDDLVTLNGGAVSGVKVQRVKVGWGADGVFNDATPANALPGVLYDGAGNIISSTLLGTKRGLDLNLATSKGGAALATGTLTGSGTSVSATVDASGNATIEISGGTYTNLPIIFEASVDGGTTWFPIDATRADGTGVDIAVLLISGILVPVRAWNVMAPGYSTVRVRQTAAAGTQVVNPTISIAQGPILYDPSPSVAPIDGQKLTYSSSINATNVASAVTASDVWCIQNPIAGTKLLRITRLYIQLTLATAGSAGQLQVVKRSSLNTGGVSVAQTPMVHESGDAATTAAVLLYTTAPTALGTAVAAARMERFFGVATTLVAQPNDQEWLFGNRPGTRAITLRPGQQLSVFNVAAFGTAPTITGDVEYTEEG